MIKKPTNELLEQLNQSGNIEQYMKDNQEYLIDCTLSEYLNDLLKEKQLIKSKVIRNAEMNEIYGFQVFSGSRNPSRDTLLSICIGMGLNAEETQATLKIAGFAPLYPKNKRDSMILFGVEHQQGVCDINNTLYEQEEKTL